MNKREACKEHIVARAEAWEVHDALVADGQISYIEDLNANEDYQRAVEKEQAAWIRYLSLRDA